MIYSCCDPARRRAVLANPHLNGIDFLTVAPWDAGAALGRHRALLVTLLKPPSGPALGPDNIEITGGERIAGIGIAWVALASSPPASLSAAERHFLSGLDAPSRTLVVRTDRAGDFSSYELHLVAATPSLVPPEGYDPLLSRIAFSFKVDCPTDFDCKKDGPCPAEPADEPAISYLAKDYQSFRRLMLERTSQLAPSWRERNPADVGVTLVEALAHVADQLSYAQDAIATEAYLSTARRRVSLRRHARLVDYHMHDGKNARAFVHIEVGSGDIFLDRAATRFVTRLPGRPPRIEPPVSDTAVETMLGPENRIFQPLHAATLSSDNNVFRFYTWGDEACCLRKGARRATLRGRNPRLEAGQILVFKEVIGPLTGRPADADPTRRHAVRIVELVRGRDPITEPATEITEIRWHSEDALPFPLCISARVGQSVVPDISIALGNIVLVDHGLTVAGEDLGAVPQPHLFVRPRVDRCAPEPDVPVPPRYYPALGRAPLTQAAVYDGSASATRSIDTALATVTPAIELSGSGGGSVETWLPSRDLLASSALDGAFVVEIERDGSARLRFGDGVRGRRPASGTGFEATYRIGNGTHGNVGADSIVHIITAADGIVEVTNPLPAAGGVEPETMEDVRRRAPYAFRTQERAVTPDDYARRSEEHGGVQKAAAAFRWTGSWYTAFVTVDRLAGRTVDPEFEVRLRTHLEPYRMAGYDLEVDSARYVPLEIAISVCAKPEFFRAHVKQAVLETLSSAVLADGRRGAFHPDSFTFAEPVYLSRIHAAVQAVAGVQSVSIDKFQRWREPQTSALASGVLQVGRLEIAQLDNDPSFPERGALSVTVAGGK